MAGPWMAVMLLLLLSDGGSAVDQNKLARLIKSINSQYRFGGMFAWALSIKDEDISNLQQIFMSNPTDTINNMINNNTVYRGSRFAVARVIQPEHAEYRLLSGLSLDSDEGDLLVFYSFASPCTSTCTNQNSPYKITDMIKKVFKRGNWTQHVWVYKVIFKPREGKKLDIEELRQGLQNLASSGITLPNIFRCFTPKNTQTFVCTSCSSAGGVTNACVDDEA